MNTYTKLAKDYLKLYLEKKDTNFDLPQEINNTDLIKTTAGVFVTLYDKKQNIKGCMGTTEPTQPNLALEIITNTICAATKDPRHKPLSAKDLADISISLDILEPLQQVESITDLDPPQYGLIIEKDDNKSIVLPHEKNIDTPEKQINLAIKKANISSGIYGCKLYKFKTKKEK